MAEYLNPGDLVRNKKTKKVYVIDTIEHNDGQQRVMGRKQLAGTGHGPTFEIKPEQYDVVEWNNSNYRYEVVGA